MWYVAEFLPMCVCTWLSEWMSDSDWVKVYNLVSEFLFAKKNAVLIVFPLWTCWCSRFCFLVAYSTAHSWVVLSPVSLRISFSAGLVRLLPLGCKYHFQSKPVFSTKSGFLILNFIYLFLFCFGATFFYFFLNLSFIQVRNHYFLFFFSFLFQKLLFCFLFLTFLSECQSFFWFFLSYFPPFLNINV